MGTNKFKAEFQPDMKMCRPLAYLTDLWNKESVSPEQMEDHPYADSCELATFTPGGPFLHAEKGFTVSIEMFHKIVPWLLANRPLNDKLYLFVHPNTGCQYNDLRHSTIWARIKAMELATNPQRKSMLIARCQSSPPA